MGKQYSSFGSIMEDISDNLYICDNCGGLSESNICPHCGSQCHKFRPISEVFPNGVY